MEHAVARLFDERIGETLDADALETVLAVAGACESDATTEEDLQDLCASLDAISAQFARQSDAAKMGLASAVLEAVHAVSSSERSGQAATTSGCDGSTRAGSCRPGLQTLQELCPGIAPDFLDHVLCREMGDVEAAAIWLTAHEALAKEADRWAAAQRAAAARQADAERAERASRKALLNRFAFQPVPAAAAAAHSRHPKGGKRAIVPGPEEPAGSKVRYRDGMPVASRGEKFVLQATKPEWDGGSQGKVFTKGKRGKGVA